MTTIPAANRHPQHALLMALPVTDPNRPKLRERVPYSADKLAAKAAKYMSMAAEYAKRRTFAREQANPPHVEPWRGFVTVQRIAHPTSYFRNLRSDQSVKTYVERFEQNAGLISVPVTFERSPELAPIAPKRPKSPPGGSYVDVSSETAYGRTATFSRAVRVF